MSISASHRYHLVEPHPSAKTSHIHTARGGAGNITRVPPNGSRGSDAFGPASRIPLHSPSVASSSSSRSQTKGYTTGRGGLGNAHAYSEGSERAIFSFDEELERQLRREREVAPVYHVGRGGAGNLSLAKPGTTRVYLDGSVAEKRRDSTASSAKSNSSAESGADAMERKLKQGLKKSWGKVIGVGSYMTG